MTSPRKPRPHDPLERQITQAQALIHRHGRWKILAWLGRDVARLGDPTTPGADERRARAILERYDQA